MSSSQLRDAVRSRAGSRCEYCILRQQHTFLIHHIEHIIARQHGGAIENPTNLALACHRCNLNKGPNLAGIDPETGETVRLFHPRLDSWGDHFQICDVEIVGITPIGRATVRLLGMNDPRRRQIRFEILARGESL